MVADKFNYHYNVTRNENFTIGHATIPGKATILGIPPNIENGVLSLDWCDRWSDQNSSEGGKESGKFVRGAKEVVDAADMFNDVAQSVLMREGYLVHQALDLVVWGARLLDEGDHVVIHVERDDGVGQLPKIRLQKTRQLIQTTDTLQFFLLKNAAITVKQKLHTYRSFDIGNCFR